MLCVTFDSVVRNGVVIASFVFLFLLIVCLRCLFDSVIADVFLSRRAHAFLFDFVLFSFSSCRREGVTPLRQNKIIEFKDEA